jgi:prevent-host-death family protein
MRVCMKISVTDARGELTELVRRAEGGDEIILTRHGQPTVRLVPIVASPDRLSRRNIMEAARRSGALKAVKGLEASRSQDFLYNDDGRPK